MCEHDVIDKTGSAYRIATSPWEDRATVTGNEHKNSATFRRVVFEISSRTDKRTNTDKQTRSSQYSATLTVRRSLTRSTLLTLVHALVVTKVDYCSSILSSISGQLLQRLQSVFNAAARLVFSARKSEHITPLLRELHWLKVPERI